MGNIELTDATFWKELETLSVTHTEVKRGLVADFGRVCDVLSQRMAEYNMLVAKMYKLVTDFATLYAGPSVAEKEFVSRGRCRMPRLSCIWKRFSRSIVGTMLALLQKRGTTSMLGLCRKKSL